MNTITQASRLLCGSRGQRRRDDGAQNTLHIMSLRQNRMGTFCTHFSARVVDKALQFATLSIGHHPRCLGIIEVAGLLRIESFTSETLNL